MTPKKMCKNLILFVLLCTTAFASEPPMQLMQYDHELLDLLTKLNELKPSERQALMSCVNRGVDECLFCCQLKEQKDNQNLILKKLKHSYIKLAEFPTTKGCLIFAPNKHVTQPNDLSPEVLCEIAIAKVLSLPILRKILNDKPKVEEFNMGYRIGDNAHYIEQVNPRYEKEGRGYLENYGPSNVIPYNLKTLFEQLKPEFDTLQLPKISISDFTFPSVTSISPKLKLLKLCHTLDNHSETERALWLQSQIKPTIRVPERETYRFINPPSQDCAFCLQRDENTDEKNYILFRTNYWMIMLNKYPYGKGGLLFTSLYHKHFPDELPTEAIAQLAILKVLSITIVGKAFKVSHFITGCGTGPCAGASVLNHFHEQATPEYESEDRGFIGIRFKDNVAAEDIPEVYKTLKPEFDTLELPNITVNIPQKT